MHIPHGAHSSINPRHEQGHLVTTEKDWIKLPHWLKEKSVHSASTVDTTGSLSPKPFDK